MAGRSPALGLPLHADIGLVAQRGRGFLFHHHPAENSPGVFKSVADLEEAIRRYIREHNGQAKPFVWTKTAEVIFEKLSRLPAHNM